MPSPTNSEVHVNRPLNNLLVAYMQTETAFIADSIFPKVQVQKQSDLYYSIPKDAWFKGGAVERAPGTPAAAIDFHVNPNNSYFAKVYAAKFTLPDQIRANYDTPLAADTLAMKFIGRNMLVTRELQWIQRYMQPGIWTGLALPTTTGPSDYNVGTAGHGFWDTSTSDPVKDVRYCKTAVQARTGYECNKLVLTKNAYDAACNNPAILDRIKYTQKGILTKELLAGIFEVETVEIVQAVLNSAQTGRTANMGFMASNSFLLCYAPPAATINEPSAGYIFTWTGYAGASAFGTSMTTYREQSLRSDVFEGEMTYDMKQVASDLGVFGVNVLQNP